MAQSVRVTDEMYARAQQAGAAMSRSLAQQFEYWARLGAALDAAGVSAQQAARLLGNAEAANALAESAIKGVFNRTAEGLPMLREHHERLAAQVTAGQRKPESLWVFSDEAVRAATVTFAPEHTPESTDDGW